MRNTKQKEFVLSFLKQTKQHPTIKQIEDFAKKSNIEIGTTTIYRILHNLTKAGLVKKVVTKDNITHYDYARNDHIHLVCNKCAEIVDVPTQQVFKNDLQSLHNFLFSPQDIALFGVCKACQVAKHLPEKYKPN